VPYSSLNPSSHQWSPGLVFCFLLLFQLFVISRTHYCQHLTFIFVIGGVEEEQEGKFLVLFLSIQCGDTLNPSSFGLTDER
jgi:hypothetical protein